MDECECAGVIEGAFGCFVSVAFLVPFQERVEACRGRSARCADACSVVQGMFLLKALVRALRPVSSASRLFRSDVPMIQ